MADLDEPTFQRRGKLVETEWEKVGVPHEVPAPTNQLVWQREPPTKKGWWFLLKSADRSFTEPSAYEAVLVFEQAGYYKAYNPSMVGLIHLNYRDVRTYVNCMWAGPLPMPVMP